MIRTIRRYAYVILFLLLSKLKLSYFLCNDTNFEFMNKIYRKCLLMNLLFALESIDKHVLSTKIEKFRKFDLFFSLFHDKFRATKITKKTKFEKLPKKHAFLFLFASEVIFVNSIMVKTASNQIIQNQVYSS